MKSPKLENVSTRYGAPMGRTDYIPQGASHKLRLAPMRMSNGDYDSGGAYWGGNCKTCGHMWIAWNTDGVCVFVRAKTREAAKELVRKALPSATFYR